MYKELSKISCIIRFYICYLTIEARPIFDESGLSWLVWQIIPIYTLFYLISYRIVGKLGYKRGDNPVLGQFYTYVIYVALAVFVWFILLALTAMGWLPI